jgi:hypothetical protein
MAYYTGQITLDSSGTGVSFNLGGRPNWIKFRVGQKAGTTETCSHVCLGQCDGLYQYCTSTYSDTSGATTVDSDTKVVSHRERVSGTITEVLQASFNSFYASGVKLNVTIPNSNYPVVVEFDI